jgi:hypothetical protein
MGGMKLVRLQFLSAGVEVNTSLNSFLQQIEVRLMQVFLQNPYRPVVLTTPRLVTPPSPPKKIMDYFLGRQQVL